LTQSCPPAPKSELKIPPLLAVLGAEPVSPAGAGKHLTKKYGYEKMEYMKSTCGYQFNLIVYKGQLIISILPQVGAVFIGCPF